MNLYGYVGNDPVNIGDPTGDEGTIFIGSDFTVVPLGLAFKNSEAFYFNFPTNMSEIGQAISGDFNFRSGVFRTSMQSSSFAFDKAGGALATAGIEAGLVSGSPDVLFGNSLEVTGNFAIYSATVAKPYTYKKDRSTGYIRRVFRDETVVSVGLGLGIGGAILDTNTKPLTDQTPEPSVTSSDDTSLGAESGSTSEISNVRVCRYILLNDVCL